MTTTTEKVIYNQVSEEYIQECGATPLKRNQVISYSLLDITEVLDDKGKFQKLYPTNRYIPETQVIYDPYAGKQSDGKGGFTYAGANVVIGLTKDSTNSELDHDYWFEKARFTDKTGGRIILSGNDPRDQKLHFVLALGNYRKDRPFSTTPAGGYMYKMDAPKLEKQEKLKIQQDRYRYEKMIREPFANESKEKHLSRIEGWLQSLTIPYDVQDEPELKQQLIVDFIDTVEGLRKFSIISSAETSAILKVAKNAESLRVIHFDYVGSGWVLSNNAGLGAFCKVRSQEEKYTELVQYLMTPQGEQYLTTIRGEINKEVA